MSLAPRDPPSSARHLRVVADDDAALVERARRDPTAFGELYRRHVRAVHAYAWRVTGSSALAEDVTAATFERALRSFATYTWQPGGLRPWLLRIAANEANGWFRRESRGQRPEAQRAMRVLSGDGLARESEPEIALDLDGWPPPGVLRAALGTLSDRHREVIGLRYLAGLSANEAADALGCSKAALAVTLHRALAALRRALPEFPEEAP